MSFSYQNLKNEEKQIFLPKIIDILRSFCNTKSELSILIEDVQKEVQKMDEFTQPIESDFETKFSVEKKIKSIPQKQLGFVDLSPNVIVYNILPFRLIDCRNEIKGKYDLFGYFKLDKMRNIWFLFTSLKLFGEYFPVPFYFCVERLFYLDCVNEFFLKKENYDFKNLEGIYVDSSSLMPIDSILKNNKFYKLKTIEFVHQIDYDVSEILNLKGIEKLKLYNGRWSLSNTNNLRVLTLNRIKFEGYEKWGELLNVEKLCIAENKEDLYKFFKFHKFERLKEFIYEDDDDLNCLEKVTVNWKYLKKIHIKSCRGFTDNFFQINEFNKLEIMILYHLDLITGNDWKIPCGIKCFEIKFCDNFEPSFFQRKELRNVEKIVCKECKKINLGIDIIFKHKIQEKRFYDNKNSFNDNLKEIVFFKSKFHTENELSNLKNLVLDDEGYTF